MIQKSSFSNVPKITSSQVGKILK